MKKTLLVTTILLVTAAGSCPADTIELHNGRVIHGKLAGELPTAGPITISFTCLDETFFLTFCGVYDSSFL